MPAEDPNKRGTEVQVGPLGGREPDLRKIMTIAQGLGEMLASREQADAGSGKTQSIDEDRRRGC